MEHGRKIIKWSAITASEAYGYDYERIRANAGEKTDNVVGVSSRWDHPCEKQWEKVSQCLNRPKGCDTGCPQAQNSAAPPWQRCLAQTDIWGGEATFSNPVLTGLSGAEITVSDPVLTGFSSGKHQLLKVLESSPTLGDWSRKHWLPKVGDSSTVGLTNVDKT